MKAQPDSDATASDAQDRASERRNFFLSTTLTSGNHSQITARVRNLSKGGMMIEFAEAPEPELEQGQQVLAELRNIGRVKGQIAWARGRRFGVKFDRVIDPEQARQPVTIGESTPDYIKPVLLPNRSLKYVEGLKGW